MTKHNTLQQHERNNVNRVPDNLEQIENQKDNWSDVSRLLSNSSDIKPGKPSVNKIQLLQRTIGNQATVRLVNRDKSNEEKNPSREAVPFQSSGKQADANNTHSSISNAHSGDGTLQAVRKGEVERVNVNQPAEITIQRTIAEFIPEAAFVEDEERGNLALFTETVPAFSILRRHDPFSDLIDNFINDFNEWVPSTWRISASVGRLGTALERGGAISPDPNQALNDRDREVLRNARDPETVDALREIRGPSVADRMENIERAISALRAARHSLEAAEARLDARKAQIERGEVEGEIAQIETKKAEIKAALTIATTMITTLAAGPAATTAAIRSQVQTRIESAPMDIMGAVVDMAYAGQLRELRERVQILTATEQAGITEQIQQNVNAALDRVSEVEAGSRVASTQARSAISNRASQFTSLGSRIDATVSEDDSMTRYQAIFQISSAVQETRAVTEHALRMAEGLPGIHAWFAATNEHGLGIPGASPTQGDYGQLITSRHMTDLRRYVAWLQDMLPSLIVWSDDWRDVTASVGNTGNEQAPY